jgi:hypothetical protein
VCVQLPVCALCLCPSRSASAAGPVTDDFDDDDATTKKMAVLLAEVAEAYIHLIATAAQEVRGAQITMGWLIPPSALCAQMDCGPNCLARVPSLTWQCSSLHMAL